MDDFDTRRPGEPFHSESDTGSAPGRFRSGYVVVPREAVGGRARALRGLAARLADLVESPVMLVLASGLCLALLLAYNIYPDPPPELPESPGTQSTAAPAAPPSMTAGNGAPTDEPADAPVSAGGDAFVVQVAAFRNQANAERLRTSLRERELDARISVLATDLHAVELGPFAERSRADTAAREVAELTGLSPLVVRTVP